MKLNKLKKLGIATMVVMLLTACSTEKLNISLNKDIVVEYGEKLDYSKLFDSENSDKGIKVDKIKNFDSKKVGKQKIEIVFKNDDKTTTKEMTVEVKDTKKPIIELSKNEVTIKKGNKLEYDTIIKKVYDEVDGELKKGKKDKKGYYWVDDSKLNTKKVGEYEVYVNALDINGLKADKVKFIVKVTDENKIQTSSNDKSNQGSISNNQNSSNNSNNSSGNGNNSNSETTPPTQHEPPKTPKPARYSVKRAYNFPNDFPNDGWSWTYKEYAWEPKNTVWSNGELVGVEWEVVATTAGMYMEILTAPQTIQNVKQYMVPAPTLEESKKIIYKGDIENDNNYGYHLFRYGHVGVYVCTE